ncbi:hypothetical protein H4219_001275 [Mycoemilia scoparia]|uniref:Uncharacterized protein n=1 Tax=Mycoemilia scoparia TaxID=417184 RepID=A0A9W8A3R2_9FUNG|nr:hypothetical protein H4219_001275 [Mycoemilia scoparia]
MKHFDATASLQATSLLEKPVLNSGAADSRSPALHRGRLHVWFTRVLLSMVLVTTVVVLICLVPEHKPQLLRQTSPALMMANVIKRQKRNSVKPVDVDLFVMSRCPDAQLVEREFNTIVDDVGPILNIKQHFIGTVNATAEYGVECKHGDSECKGNIEQLCAHSLHKNELNVWWRFVSCLNTSPALIGKSEQLTLLCASQAGVDEDKLLQCRDSEEGRELLKKSATEAQEQGIKTSATVFINGKLRCVEDSGWRECQGGHLIEDFERDICRAYGDKPTAPFACQRFIA